MARVPMHNNQEKHMSGARGFHRAAVSAFYPVIAYFLVSAFASLLLSFLSLDAVVRQALTSCASGAAVYVLFARSDKRVFFAPVRAQSCVGALVALVWLGCAGVAVNNVIAWSGLQQLSDTYRQVEQTFYSSDVLREILALGVVTPLAEELLYRQVVFGRLREQAGRGMAIIGSALIFGVFHMNIVQAVYAFVLGLFLALLMEAYQDVRVPFLGHLAANTVAILRGETGFLSWLVLGEPLFVPVTLVLLVIAAVIAGYYVFYIYRNDSVPS